MRHYFASETRTNLPENSIVRDITKVRRGDAYDEVIADSMESILADGKVMELMGDIEAADKTLGGKIKAFFRDIGKLLKQTIRAYSHVKPDSEEGRMVQGMQDIYDQLQQVFAKGVYEGGDNYRKAEKNTTNDGGVKYSAGDNNSGLQDYNKPITLADVKLLQEIGRKSIYAFSKHELEIAQKWAYKFYRELGVKSPFFRAWFGEWRGNGQDAVVIIEQDKMQMLANGKARNNDTGITMSWNAHDIIRETAIHAARSRISTQAINQLPEIIEKAILLDTVVSTPSSRSKMNNTALMHSFYAVYKADGEIHVLKLYAEQALNNKGTAEFTRAYQLKDIKKVAVLGDGVSKGKPLLSGANTATINSISKLIDIVKQNDPEYEPKPSSKVVNPDGTPKVMYHGSPAQFTIFDKKKAKSSGAYGSGFYFTDSQSHAATYGQQYSVYLNIRNPLQYGNSTVNRAQVRKYLEAVAENEDYSVENYGTYDVDSILQNIMGKESKVDAFKAIQDISATAIGDMVEAVELFNQVNGTKYDGIITATETVAFYPEQIKSATDNIGTFDGGNPDIRFSARKGENDAAQAVLEQENTQLKKEVSRLKELLKLQRTVTNGTKFTKASVEAAARMLKQTI